MFGKRLSSYYSVFRKLEPFSDAGNSWSSILLYILFI